MPANEVLMLHMVIDRADPPDQVLSLLNSDAIPQSCRITLHFQGVTYEITCVQLQISNARLDFLQILLDCT
jgi:hypothetical protein